MGFQGSSSERQKKSNRKATNKAGLFQDSNLKALKPESKTYWESEQTGDPETRGFSLKVSPAGTKTFYTRYTLNRQRKYFKIGVYGEKLSLREAREQCKTARKLIEQGIDPQIEHDKELLALEDERKRIEREKAERKAAATVDMVLDHYLEGVSSNTASDAGRLFKNQYADVRKEIGSILIKEVTEEMLEQLIDRHIERGKMRNAGKLFAYLQTAFKKGKKHKSFMLKRWSNPFDGMDKPEGTDSNAVDRALNTNEIKQFWKLLEENPSTMMDGAIGILKVLLLTGQRVEQTSRMRWADIDLSEGIWDVPADETKSGKKSGVGHVVPLTPMAVKIIKSQPVIEGETLVFPGRHGGKPFSISGISNPLQKLLTHDKELEPFTPRDLRRTCTTHWSKLGILSEVRNRIQNHSIAGSVEGKHYDRYDYLKEKRAALEKWERELKQILGDPVSNNVVALSR